MVGEDYSVDDARALFARLASAGERLVVPALGAAGAEVALRYLGLCNWLVDYGPDHREYCGRHTDGELCTEHVHNMFLMGDDGPEPDLDRTGE